MTQQVAAPSGREWCGWRVLINPLDERLLGMSEKMK